MKNNKGIVSIVAVLLGVIAVLSVTLGGLIVHKAIRDGKRSAEVYDEDVKDESDEPEADEEKEDVEEKITEPELSPEQIRLSMYEKFLNNEITAVYNGENCSVKDLRFGKGFESTSFSGVGTLYYAYIDVEDNGNGALELKVSDNISAAKIDLYYVLYYDGNELAVKASTFGDDLCYTSRYNEKYVQYQYGLITYGFDVEEVFQFNENYELVEAVKLYRLWGDVPESEYIESLNMKRQEGYVEGTSDEFFNKMNEKPEEINYIKYQADISPKMQAYEDFLINYVTSDDTYVSVGMAGIPYEEYIQNGNSIEFQIANVEGNELLFIRDGDSTNCCMEWDGEVKGICSDVGGYDKESGDYLGYFSVSNTFEKYQIHIENGEGTLVARYTECGDIPVRYTKWLADTGVEEEITKEEFYAFGDDFTSISEYLGEYRALNYENIIDYFEY